MKIEVNTKEFHQNAIEQLHKHKEIPTHIRNDIIKYHEEKAQILIDKEKRRHR